MVCPTSPGLLQLLASAESRDDSMALAVVLKAADRRRDRRASRLQRKLDARAKKVTDRRTEEAPQRGLTSHELFLKIHADAIARIQKERAMSRSKS
mmetsp:Transcript_11203/g.34811  ORF Transcript_11203/g.34811 Transcript_11203/m.34811 type:complete len:96 (-) Transcript_11203:21-308(-)